MKAQKDISLNRGQLEEILERARALDEKVSLFREMIESSPCPTIAFGRDGKVLYQSRSFLAQIGNPERLQDAKSLLGDKFIQEALFHLKRGKDGDIILDHEMSGGSLLSSQVSCRVWTHRGHSIGIILFFGGFKKKTKEESFFTVSPIQQETLL